MATANLRDIVDACRDRVCCRRQDEHAIGACIRALDDYWLSSDGALLGNPHSVQVDLCWHLASNCNEHREGGVHLTLASYFYHG